MADSQPLDARPFPSLDQLSQIGNVSGLAFHSSDQFHSTPLEQLLLSTVSQNRGQSVANFPFAYDFFGITVIISDLELSI